MAARNKSLAVSKIGIDDSFPDQDNIEMCHAQGKPAIIFADDEGKVIRTTWPNGMVDHKIVATGMVTRIWPDGREECFDYNNKRNTRQVISRD